MATNTYQNDSKLLLSTSLSSSQNNTTHNNNTTSTPATMGKNRNSWSFNKKRKKQNRQKSPTLVMKENKAALRIQKFWNKGKGSLKWKNTAELARQKKKKLFANVIIFFMIFITIVSFLATIYTNGRLYEYVSEGFNVYLLLLLWAATLPLQRNPWQLMVGIPIPFINLITIIIINYSSKGEWIVLIVNALITLGVPAFLYWLLPSMANALRYNYSKDLHGVSARLSSKIIAGLPIVCYFCMTGISCIISEKLILDDLCPYVPGAYFDNTQSQTGSITKGLWVNCTEPSSQFDRYFPDLPQTAQEIMLEDGIKDFAANAIKFILSTWQILEWSLLVITSQVLLRICRLSIEDILSVNISTSEFTLTIVTILRLGFIFTLDGFNLEIMSYSQSRLLLQIFLYTTVGLNFLTFILIVKLVKDSNIVIYLEKEGNKKDQKPKKKVSKSVEMIYKRHPRFSIMSPGGKST